MKVKLTFEQYDKANPIIWERFKNIAFQTKRKGFKRFSSKALFEIIRWQTGPTLSDGFKVNNNYTAGYSSKMMRLYPEFEGFFEIRTSKK